MAVGIMSVAILVLIVVSVVIGMRWYLKRAGNISSTNSIRKDFQRVLLLNLQDIREDAEGDLATVIDELIDIARYSTPASNDRTTELDMGLSEEAASLAEEPTVDGALRFKQMLVSRNRRAKQ